MAVSQTDRSYDERRTLRRPGTTLSVAVRAGTRPPLVLVPGAMSDAETWRPVVDALPGGREVHVLERRGRAPSGPLGPDYAVEAEIGDVAALLDDVPGPKHLFGWSLGGLFALEAALGRDDVLSVVVHEPASRPFVPSAIEPIRAAVEAGDLDRAVELVNVDVSGFSAEHVAALRAEPVWADLRRFAAPFGEELAALNRFTPRFDAYPGLPMPVTLLLGERNEGGAEPYGAAFDRFRAALPDATVEVLPGIGHLSHVEGPELLAARIAAALPAFDTPRVPRSVP